MTRWARGLWVAACLAAACTGDVSTTPQRSAGPLPSGVAARVGDQDVATLTVARIAAKRELPVAEAAELAVQDALMAAGAKDRLGAHRVQLAEDTVLGRALLRQLWLDESAKPISDEDLSEVTDAFWTHYDRPVGYRVVHALALLPRDASAADREAARAHAEKMHDAVEAASKLARKTPLAAWDEERLFQPTRDRGPASKKFKELAKAVPMPPHAHFQVKAQELPALTAEGQPIQWGINRRNTTPYVPDFVRGMADLKERGDLSGIVESPFGYHVIMLLEITPAHQLSKAERLEKLRDELLRVRGLRAKRALLEKLRGAAQVDVAANQDALLELIEVDDSTRDAAAAEGAAGDEGEQG